MYVTLKRVAVTELKLLADAIRDSIVPLELERYRRTVEPRPSQSPDRFGESFPAARKAETVSCAVG